MTRCTRIRLRTYNPTIIVTLTNFAPYSALGMLRLLQGWEVYDTMVDAILDTINNILLASTVQSSEGRLREPC